jgi:ribosomal protein S8
MNCSLGGFINARHDNIRDLECKLLKSVQNDVECEPILRPVLNKTGYPRTAKLEDNARLDIRACGFWRDGQNAYFDVRVTNADNESQQNTSLKSVLRKHEQEKKRCYNKRIMEVEHGTFTPLVFTTTGVMSHECAIFHKCLAH